MEITRSARPRREMADVKLWHCGGCDAVHMAVKEMTFNFTRDEFSAFAEAVIDINYSGWPGKSDDPWAADIVSHLTS